MKKSFCAFVFLGLLIAGTSWAQQKAQIRIKKNINGVESEETREFMLEDNRQLEEVLKEINEQNSKESGILDQQIEISIQSTGEMPFGGSAFSFPNAFAPFPTSGKPSLGVMLKQIDTQERKSTSRQVMITEVMPNMPASRAGLQKGDIILSINGEKIQSSEQVLNHVHALDYSGGKLNMVVKRNKRKKKITAELPGMPRHQWQAEQLPKPFDRNLQDSVMITQPFNFNNEGFSAGETAYLGVTPANQPSTVGVAVMVEDKSPAADMGLIDGDIILECNGEAIGDFNALAGAVRKCKPGSSIELLISRDGKEKRLTGALGKRALSASEDFQIFHDYKGMDEQGNQFFDFEFNMDADDLQKQMEQFLRDFNMNAPMPNELYPGLEKTPDYVIGIEEVESDERVRFSLPEGRINFEQLSMVPRQANGSVEIAFTLSRNEPFLVTVKDSEEQVLLYDERSGQELTYTRSFDLNDYPQGAYYFIITQGNLAYIKRLNKQSK